MYSISQKQVTAHRHTSWNLTFPTTSHLIWIGLFIAGFLLSLVLLMSTEGFIGTDDYYHSRISEQILIQKRLNLSFLWLPLTILNEENFVDHHLLYHIYLAPWMYWGSITGVKIAQSIVFAGIVLAFWALLRLLRVNHAWIWTASIIALSSPFLYRMLMIRTQSVAVLLLLLALHALFQQRYRWLLPSGFAFTWLYNGFVLMPAFVVLYVMSFWLARREVVWKPLVYVSAGVALGIIINPYFPQNIVFILDHLGEKVSIAESIRVGSEWYPYTTTQLLEHSFGAMLALGIGITAGSLRSSGRDYVETTLLFIALLTLYMLFQSRRFIEYFPIFSLLFCAVAWGRSSVHRKSLLPATLLRHPVAYLPRIIIVISIFALSGRVLQTVYTDIQNVKDFNYMAGASTWLEANTEEGELIFQTDWDDFTRLFYHNTRNTYLVGLDPTYLQIAEPFMWNQWVAITQGVVERPSVLIHDTFGARYAVSDTRHDAFAERADADPAMILVYRDDNSLIWQIIDPE